MHNAVVLLLLHAFAWGGTVDAGASAQVAHYHSQSRSIPATILCGGPGHVGWVLSVDGQKGEEWPYERLLRPFTVDTYVHRPTLESFLDTYAFNSGLRVAFDRQALQESNIRLEQKLCTGVQAPTTRSGLRLILDRYKMAFVIVDKHLVNITDEKPPSRYLNQDKRFLVTTEKHALSLRTKGLDEGTLDLRLHTLKDKEVAKRRDMAYAAGQVRLDAAEAIPLLLEALNDPDPQVRFDTVYALGGLGAKAEPASNSLMNMVREGQDGFRLVAAVTVAKIGGTGLRALQDATSAVDVRVRWAAIDGLGHVGDRARTQILEIFEDFKRNPKDARFGTKLSVALSTLDPEVVVPTMVTTLEDSDPEIRKFALQPLLGMGPLAQAAVPQLVKALNDPDPKTRQIVVRVLTEIGPAARPAATALLDVLRTDHDNTVREAAARGLRHILVKDHGAVELLLELIRRKDEDEEVRRAATGSVAELARDDLPLLISLLSEPHADVRAIIARMLGELGSSAAPAVDALTELLKDEDPTVRRAAAAALEEISSTPKHKIHRSRTWTIPTHERLRTARSRSEYQTSLVDLNSNRIAGAAPRRRSCRS